jgi:hypothetical protein
MEKIKVKKVIFWDKKDTKFTWKDLKHIKFEDDDMIEVQYEEPYYSENESHGEYFHCQVTRMVEETDEDFEVRMSTFKKMAEESKKKRYENYLKLKEEFEK